MSRRAIIITVLVVVLVVLVLLYGLYNGVPGGEMEDGTGL
jgi:hypothetical protein